MTPDETIEDRERYQDETVHELYGNLASAVNNVGIEAQLKFIFEQCGDQAWDWLGCALDKWEFKS